MTRTTRRARLLGLCALTMALGAIAMPAQSMAQEAEEEPEYSKEGADTCFKCHDDQVVLSIFRTRHAVPSDPNSPFGHGQLQCEACHGPGGDHSGRVRRGRERPPMVRFGSDSGTPIAEQNAYCLDCHQSSVGFAWHGSGHDSNEVACADCHDSHVERDPVLHASTQTDVCTDCHQQQRTQSMKAFAHPLRQGKMSCGSCHNPHGETTDGILARSTVNQTCYDCHAELRGPYLWEHAPAADDCASCHEPHGSNQPGMLAQRAPLLCQSCHSVAGHPSLPQDERGLPSGAPSQFLLGRSCLNCHSQVHGSNHPSGTKLMR